MVRSWSVSGGNEAWDDLAGRRLRPCGSRGIREGGENSLQVRVVEEVGARCVDGSEGRQSVEPGHREQPEGHAAHQSNDLLQPVKGVEELIL